LELGDVGEQGNKWVGAKSCLTRQTPSLLLLPCKEIKERSMTETGRGLMIELTL
jgi:hypothetical protein